MQTGTCRAQRSWCNLAGAYGPHRTATKQRPPCCAPPHSLSRRADAGRHVGRRALAAFLLPLPDQLLGRGAGEVKGRGKGSDEGDGRRGGHHQLHAEQEGRGAVPAGRGRGAGMRVKGGCQKGQCEATLAPSPGHVVRATAWPTEKLTYMRAHIKLVRHHLLDAPSGRRRRLGGTERVAVRPLPAPPFPHPCSKPAPCCCGPRRLPCPAHNPSSLDGGQVSADVVERLLQLQQVGGHQLKQGWRGGHLLLVRQVAGATHLRGRATCGSRAAQGSW